MEDARKPPVGAGAQPDGDALPSPVAAEVGLLFEHLNEGHPDTVLLLASLADDAVAEAELAHADRGGVRLVARRNDGTPTTLFLPFSGRPEAPLAIRAEVFAMLHRARERAGDRVPLTSLERELAETARLTTYVTSVADTSELTPRLRRITLRGGLAGYVPRGPDQFVYVMVDRPGRAAGVIAPGFRMEHLQRVPEDDRPAAAYYTVRRFDAARDEIELWCVLHDHAGGVSAWARAAKTGDTVALWGPRVSFDPPPCESMLVLGDETALPAIAAILEQHGASTRIHAIVETGDASDVIDLPGGPGVSLAWLFRGDRAPGTSGRLLAAVRELSVDPDLGYAFGAGETHEIAAVRRYLRSERGLPAPRVRMVGYWRRTPAA